MLAGVFSGWLERDDVLLIPDELRPEFNVAVEPHGATADEDSDWRLMYSMAARRFDFSSVDGYSGKDVPLLLHEAATTKSIFEA